jgi:flagella basal body P-ring formation protein FlgA
MDLPGRVLKLSIATMRTFYIKSICSLDSIEMDKDGYIKVRTKSGEIDRDSLQAMLLRELLPITKGVYEEDWELDATKIPPRVIVPDGDYSPKLEIPPRYDGRGAEMATMRIYVAGKEKMKIALPFLVKRWGTVVRTISNIQRGQKIQNADVAVERVEITNIQRPIVTSLNDAVGRVALRTISRDQDLQETWLERPWLVKEGDQIRMNVDFGMALVSVVGVAKENGYKGQRIEVENPDTGKRFQAEVDAPGEVRVLN